MIPLRDTIRSSTVPVVNYAIIVLCFFGFIYELSLGPALEPFLQRHAIVPLDISSTILAGHPTLPAFMTLLSTLFLHGGWLHLLGNMLYLYVFGDNVEDRLGHVPYLLFYLICGIVAGLVQVWAQPESTVPLIGASGAIAGVLGAYFILYPRARVLTLVPLFLFFPVIEVPALFFLGIWFVMQIFSGTLSGQSDMAGGIAWWAHTGGFLGGAILLPLFLLTSRRRALS